MKPTFDEIEKIEEDIKGTEGRLDIARLKLLSIYKEEIATKFIILTLEISLRHKKKKLDDLKGENNENV